MHQFGSCQLMGLVSWKVWCLNSVLRLVSWAIWCFNLLPWFDARTHQLSNLVPQFGAWTCQLSNLVPSFGALIWYLTSIWLYWFPAVAVAIAVAIAGCVLLLLFSSPMFWSAINHSNFKAIVPFYDYLEAVICFCIIEGCCDPFVNEGHYGHHFGEGCGGCHSIEDNSHGDCDSHHSWLP